MVMSCSSAPQTTCQPAAAMGAYLFQSNTVTCSSDKVGTLHPQLPYGLSAMQGWCIFMEDCYKKLSQVHRTWPDLIDQKIPDDELIWYTNGSSFIKNVQSISLCNSSGSLGIRYVDQFIHMVYYIDRLSYVEPSLHLWDKAYLVMVDNVFDVFLESVCQYFIEYFCIYVHEGDCLDKGLSILLIFSKNQLVVSLVLCIVFFVSILLIYAPNLIISLHLFLLGDFVSSCSRAISVNLVHLSIGESGVLKSPTTNVCDLIRKMRSDFVSILLTCVFYWLGKFSSMILLNMFSVPLSWYSSPSSIPIIRSFFVCLFLNFFVDFL
ncbi:hypothetical protein STEG23_011437 [Scotinomys teguina]